MKSLSANQSASTILVILLKLLNRKKTHKKSYLRANISFTVKSKQKKATGTNQTEGSFQNLERLYKERARTADNFLKTAPLDWRRLTQANSRYPN